MNGTLASQRAKRSTTGERATRVGIVLGSITAFVIDRKLAKTAAFALAEAVLTFFTLIDHRIRGRGAPKRGVVAEPA